MTDPQSVTFTIAQVDQVISGVNKNGPWTLWSVSARDGTKYRTFEDSYAARVGQTVTVQVEKRVKRGRSKNFENLFILPAKEDPQVRSTNGAQLDRIEQKLDALAKMLAAMNWAPPPAAPQVPVTTAKRRAEEYLQNLRLAPESVNRIWQQLGVLTGGLAAGEQDWARMACVLEYLSTGETVEKAVIKAWEKYPKQESVSR